MENDKELETFIWLKFKMAANHRKHEATMKCNTCYQFQEKLQLINYYSLRSLMVHLTKTAASKVLLL